MIDIQMLRDLRVMLERWGIPPDDWYVTGEAAMVLTGFPIDFREGQIDILVCRDRWPWNREEEQVSLFPDKQTKEEEQLRQFIATHKMMPDFHPLPHVGICAEDRFDHSAYHPEAHVRVLKPWAGVYHRELIISFYQKEHPQGLDVFDQAKFIRRKKFVEQTQAQAEQLGDQETVVMCERVLPVVQTAIDYFETKACTSSAVDELRGVAAFLGRVSGPIKHWEEGGDFKGKIAVLTHMLPSQVTVIREAAAIITDQGGTLSHAATVAREYQIPTIIGTKRATQILKDCDLVEVNADAGWVRILK